MNATVVLALMLALIAPGQSSYSVVPVDAHAPAPCERRHDPLCRKPWYSAHHKGHVRVETYDEGLRRYWLVAQTIAEQTAGDLELSRLVTTVAFHESGFRRDVHSGVGVDAKGDAGRSWCLVQQMLGQSGRGKTRTGVPAFKLVGVDVLATERCIGAGVHDLILVRKRGAKSARAYFAGYGGLKSDSRHPYINARVATYDKLTAMGEPELSAEVREALGIGDDS